MYTVKYKNDKNWVFNKINKVDNDWIYFDNFPSCPRRAFMDKNKNVYEIDLTNNIVIFSNGRPNNLPKSQVSFKIKYKKSGSLFWSTIKNVVVETVMYEKTSCPIKVLITETGERWEIPMSGFEFIADKNRLLAIQSMMEKESGQSINAIK